MISSLRRLRSCQHRQGFTLIEAMVAAAILTVSLGALAVLSANQFNSSQDVDTLDKIENAVATDLGWIKNYAKIWRMSYGPYNLTAAQSGTTSFTSSPNVSLYDPVPTDCPQNDGTGNETLATNFLNDAGSNSSAGSLVTPSRPNPVAAGTIQIPVSGLPSDLALYRTIKTDKSETGRNLVYVTYSLAGNQALPFNFRRDAAIRLEASAWCPA